MGERKSIDVDRLVVDEENPRFDAVGTENDALFSILEDQALASDNKILTLARSIAKDGLNASELLVISPIADTGTYRVREGNRRVTAIKLSLHPDLVPDGFEALRSHFAALSDAMQHRRIVSCYITNDDTEIRNILTLRHAGENGGVGVVRWNAVQKERFAQGGNQQTARAISLIDSIRKLIGDGGLVFTAVGIPATNIGRLISTPEVRNALGIVVDGARARYLGGHDELLLDVLTTVKRDGVVPIYRKEDRIRLVEDAQRRIEPDGVSQGKLPLTEANGNSEEKPVIYEQAGNPYDGTPITSGSSDAEYGNPYNSRYNDKARCSSNSPAEVTWHRVETAGTSHGARHTDLSYDDEDEKPSRRKPVSHAASKRMFGCVLRPRGTSSNDLYRAIDWLDGQYLRNPDELTHILPILGFSLRLLLETVAREYYESLGKEPGDNALNSFMKDVAKPAIKERLNDTSRNGLSLASEWIDGDYKFEALLAKWAHGTLPVDRTSLVRQSELVAIIINEIWSEEARRLEGHSSIH